MLPDKEFIADLKRSDGVVNRTAEFLRGKGQTVMLPPLMIRPNFDSRADYQDGGDLFLVQLIEVKHRPEIHFTSREDFPFDTVIVDAKNLFDRKAQKPYAYIIWNAQETHCFYIPVATTRKHWKVVERYDSRIKETGVYYECPVDILKVLKRDCA